MSVLAVLKPKTRFSYRSGSFGRLGYPLWCLRAGSGCRRRPLRGRALPLSYRGIWCERLDSDQRRRDYQSRIPPTELRSHIKHLFLLLMKYNYLLFSSNHISYIDLSCSVLFEYFFNFRI